MPRVYSLLCHRSEINRSGGESLKNNLNRIYAAPGLTQEVFPFQELPCEQSTGRCDECLIGYFPSSSPQTAHRMLIDSGKGEQGLQLLAGNALTLGKRTTAHPPFQALSASSQILRPWPTTRPELRSAFAASVRAPMGKACWERTTPRAVRQSA